MSDSLWELVCFGAYTGVTAVVLHEGLKIVYPHTMNDNVVYFFHVAAAAAIVKKFHQ
jgi:hypothetical protein